MANIDNSVQVDLASLAAAWFQGTGLPEDEWKTPMFPLADNAETRAHILDLDVSLARDVAVL